jgi:putative transcriptional regulator
VNKSSGIITNLSGHFLLATEEMADSYFEDTLIFVCTHEEDMTLGLVINQEMIEFSFEQIIESLKDEIDLKRENVTNWPMLMAGGPVDIERGLVIHSNDYKSAKTIELTDDIFLTSTADIVKDIAIGKGPESYNLCMGYSGWNPLQLEDEIAHDCWMVTPATTEILFKTPLDERYGAAAEMMGLNFTNFAGFTGEA